MAAVHLKPELADRIGENYLNAPREALPPPQGTDAVLVLTQALVARRRRRMRDVLVLVLVLVAGLVAIPYSFAFLFGWGALWLFWSLAFASRQLWTGAPRKPRADEEETSIIGLVSTLAFFVGWLSYTWIGVRVSTTLAGLSTSADDGFGTGSAESTTSAPWAVAVLLPVLLFVLCAVAIFAVLLLDKWVTRHLIASGGNRTPVGTNSVVAKLADSLIAGVTRRHSALLEDVARKGDESSVLPHAGWHAFVGHGHRVNAWTLPLVLRARDRTERTPTLHPRELYSAVTSELHSMQDSDLLTPSRRLRELRVSPQIVVNTENLHRNWHTPTAQALLSRDNGLPVSDVDQETMDLLVDEDLEWVRHFQRTSVLSWNSDLLVSTLFNIGCDDRTLYLEWNAYCLYPMAPRYRLRGVAGNSTREVAATALLEFCQLLGSIAWRWRTLLGSLPHRRITSEGSGEVRSIRELAADEECVNEFQDLDGQRHITLLQERTLSAVRNHLVERGFSTEALEEQATRIINNTTNNFHGSQFLGAQNFGANGTATAVPTSSTATHGPGRESG
ncbi:hypothetical protein FHR84_003443 [Actinopolyspora biskrensis]|uniref:Uncharacterized protein n=1 Tax=Actinopolyspora biskrensis TaxID=1470178 RepID=A0A852YYC7_9ACTN|nr:hypothetical protein [Actinopolyspora biskrensis]